MNPLIYDKVIEWIPQGARVLDLGTGDGAFLERLTKSKKIVGEGVEIDPELVTRCIERGLVVHQGNILDGLDQYGTEVFDYVLLLGTFQELIPLEHVMREAFRVGKRVIVSFSNFAHLKVRLQLLLHGRSPVTPALPEPWYKTHNLRFFSVLDFKDLCNTLGINEIDSAYFNSRGRVKFCPNLFCEEAVTLLELKK